jgi:hypothetical protein
VLIQAPAGADLYAWGAQVEVAASAGPYVRTTSAAKINQPSTYPFSGGIQESQVLPGTITRASLSPSAGILGSQLDPAAGISSGQISDLSTTKLTGTITNPQIAAGAVDHSKLAALCVEDGNIHDEAVVPRTLSYSLRGSLKVTMPQVFKCPANAILTLNAADLDPEGIVAGNLLEPKADISVHLTARVAFNGNGDTVLDVGDQAKLLVWDETNNVCFAAGDWYTAKVDATSGVIWLVARFSEPLQLVGGTNYSLRFLGQKYDGSVPVPFTWKRPASDLSTSPFDSGSFIHATPLPT